MRRHRWIDHFASLEASVGVSGETWPSTYRVVPRLSCDTMPFSIDRGSLVGSKKCHPHFIYPSLNMTLGCLETAALGDCSRHWRAIIFQTEGLPAHC